MGCRDRMHISDWEWTRGHCVCIDTCCLLLMMVVIMTLLLTYFAAVYCCIPLST